MMPKYNISPVLTYKAQKDFKLFHVAWNWDIHYCSYFPFTQYYISASCWLIYLNIKLKFWK
jgi:hypothetical protein